MAMIQTPFIPAWLDDLPLNPFEMRVLVHIWRRGRLFASLQKTAEHLHISKRQVQECLKHLVHQGYLRKHDKGDRVPAEYVPIHNPVVAQPAIAHHAIAQEDASIAYSAITIAHHAIDDDETIAPHATTIAQDATGYSTTCHHKVPPLSYSLKVEEEERVSTRLQQQEVSNGEQWEEGQSATSSNCIPFEKQGKPRQPSVETELPLGWELPETWGNWALTTLKWDGDKVLLEEEKFRKHYHSETCRNPKQRDWQECWEKWCLRDKTFEFQGRKAIAQ